MREEFVITRDNVNKTTIKNLYFEQTQWGSSEEGVTIYVSWRKKEKFSQNYFQNSCLELFLLL